MSYVVSVSVVAPEELQVTISDVGIADIPIPVYPIVFVTIGLLEGCAAVIAHLLRHVALGKIASGADTARIVDAGINGLVQVGISHRDQVFVVVFPRAGLSICSDSAGCQLSAREIWRKSPMFQPERARKV